MTTEQGTTRRRFLAGAGGAASALSLWPGASAFAASSSGARVAVLGGGVSGLTAAHELAERGYAVTVYEYYDVLGGKARSIPVPGSASDGRKPLPGEHGFRFIPGFYRNLPDTLRRIPYPGNANGVHDNLRAGTETLFARSDGRADLHFPLRRVTTPPHPGDLTPAWIRDQLLSVLGLATRMPAYELGYFVDRLLVFLTSCETRRDEQWERVPWWDFIGAEDFSEEYRRMFAIGQSRNLTATKAEESSTRTVAGVYMENFLVFGLLGLGQDGDIDRVLDGPTTEAWLDPWVARLRSLGVEFVLSTSVQDVLYENGRIAGVRVTAPDGTDARTITADHYISALPVEHARPTWGPALRAADPQLARCDALRTDWMVGVQYYMRTPTPMVNGHVNCLDSPWSVTAVGQAQFWDAHDFPADYGDGRAVDCVSAIASEWDKPGILYGKTAKQCTREEFVAEVWAQLQDAVGVAGDPVLKDEDRLGWFLDPAVTGMGGPNPANREQLLIHPVGSLYNRPSAKTAVPNFFLAGDYVRTGMNLASMEGANEAARHAVNALLDADGSGAARCATWGHYQPPELEPLKRIDEVRYRLGLPNTFDLG